MENQHRAIKGYRELSQEEIDKVNEVKDIGVHLDFLIQKIEDLPDIDKRWSSIAKTHFQQGLMALTRSITRPTFF